MQSKNMQFFFFLYMYKFVLGLCCPLDKLTFYSFTLCCFSLNSAMFSLNIIIVLDIDIVIDIEIEPPGREGVVRLRANPRTGGGELEIERKLPRGGGGGIDSFLP
jgi:hypothetical protein